MSSSLSKNRRRKTRQSSPPPQSPPASTTNTWSSMMEPLLLDILRRLDTLEAFSAFRRVCRSWRTLAKSAARGILASQHPLAYLSSSTKPPALVDVVCGRSYRDHLLLSSADCLVGSAHGHLVVCTDSSSSNVFHWRILSIAGDTVHLPKLRVPRIARKYNRVLFSSHPSNPDCFLLLFKCGRIKMMHYLSIGDPARWKSIKSFKKVKFACDMIFFKNKLYCLAGDMKLYSLDLLAEARPKYKILGDGKESPFAARIYYLRLLAVAGEELLAVCYKPGPEPQGFDIFRWDFGGSINGWEEEKEDLGGTGRVLFMGKDGFSGTLDGGEMGLRGECIHYIDIWSGKLVQFSLKDQSIVHDFPPLPELAKGLFWVLPSNC